MSPRHESEAERQLSYWWHRFPDYRGFVYVIGAPPMTAIKVGYARSVRRRMASLQTACPYELKLLHVIPGDQRLETLLHRKLKDSRVLNEWFDGPDLPDFLTYVEKLAWAVFSSWKPGHKAPRHYAEIDPELREEPDPKAKYKVVTVRYEAPCPQATPEEALELRRAAILGKHPLGRKPSRRNW